MSANLSYLSVLAKFFVKAILLVYVIQIFYKKSVMQITFWQTFKIAIINFYLTISI
jgi:hypothetical protein